MKSKPKIYTRTGDEGETSLPGGTRVPKFHKRIEAYGTVDELNSHIGLLRDLFNDAEIKKKLLQIQNILFTVQSILAAENETTVKNLPAMKPDHITLLENEIDHMDSVLPRLSSFILPGGHTTVSFCHITRCVCRRAERIIVELTSHFEVDRLIICFLNRLSDYLFVLARKTAADNNAEEVQWKVKH